MKSFTEWLKTEGLGAWWQRQLDARNAELAHRQAKHERDSKLMDMRHWLFNKGRGDKSPAPYGENDPDYAWLQKELAKWGPLDPNRNSDMGPWGYGAGVNPGA